MVGNELLHSESISGKVYEACDAGHAEMGTLERSTKTQMYKKQKTKTNERVRVIIRRFVSSSSLDKIIYFFKS